MEILSTNPDDQNPIRVSAHPVTRVYCDKHGIVCYERHHDTPIRLDQVSPKRSRLEALRRCDALLDENKDELMRRMPISSTGIGLTYNDLKVQTYNACLKSREVESKIRDTIDSKRK